MHANRFLDAKVKDSGKHKAEEQETHHIKNKREYEIARFHYIHRLNIISMRKDIDVLGGVGAAGRAFVQLGLVGTSHSGQDIMEQINEIESILEVCVVE